MVAWSSNPRLAPTVLLLLCTLCCTRVAAAPFDRPAPPAASSPDGASGSRPQPAEAGGDWRAKRQEAQSHFEAAHRARQEANAISRGAWRRLLYEDPAISKFETSRYHETRHGFLDSQISAGRDEDEISRHDEKTWQAHGHLIASMNCGVEAVKMRCAGRSRQQVKDQLHKWHSREAQKHLNQFKKIYRDEVSPAYRSAQRVEEQRAAEFDRPGRRAAAARRIRAAVLDGQLDPNSPHEVMASAIEKARVHALAFEDHRREMGYTGHSARAPLAHALPSLRTDAAGNQIAPFSHWHRLYPTPPQP